jgi:hypothetical protein
MVPTVRFRQLAQPVERFFLAEAAPEKQAG